MGPDLGRVAAVPPRAFAAFRIAFGLFLTVHFAALVPYGPELFGADGLLPDPALSFTAGVLPNPLAWWDGPRAVTGFLVGLVVLSLAFTAGVARRTAAVLLWYGAACLFNRNNLIANPSLPYVGVLLLACATIPAGEGWSLGRRPTPRWAFPAWTLIAVWVLFAVGYTFSGLDKLICSPSWRDGSALSHIAALPLARPHARDLLGALPAPLLQLMSWGALALEVLCLPLCLHRRTRPLAWLGLTGMQVGILASIDFADLTCGMLMVHAFLCLEPTWVGQLSGRARKAARSQHLARP